MNNERQPRLFPRRLGVALTSMGTLCLVTAALLTTGCGGSGGSTDISPQNPAASVLLEGRAADGYLSDALVFLDINGNKMADPDEPQTTSGSGGRFSLPVAPGQELLYPVVVRVDKGRTIDEDDGGAVPFEYLLETPIGRHEFISPLTTLVKQELDKNTLFREEDAVNLVRTRFGLGEAVSIWQDFIAAERSAPEAPAWRHAHETAKVLANLHGVLMEEFRTNLGGSLQDGDYLPATRVIGDLQMASATDIANSLSGITPAAVGSRTNLIDRLLGKIDLTSLNRQLLSRYRRLIERRPETWDATPPSIVTRQPGDGSSVPVTSRIEIVFSEALDPTTVTTNAVLLRAGSTTHPGTVAYDSSRLLLTMVPERPLYAYTDYTVEIDAGLADPAGNALNEVRTWSFSTLFEHAPPALPDF